MCVQVCIHVFMCIQVCIRAHMWCIRSVSIMFPLLATQSVTGDLDPSQPLSALHLVELSAVTPSGQDTIESEMKAFADHLKPYPCC